MSHEVETMVIADGRPAWHGLGKVLNNPLTSAEAIKEAGLDWDVELANLIVAKDEDIILNEHKAVVRTSDNKVLSVVGNRYKPIQNIEAFEFMDSLVEDGEMKYHTAGSLRGGQKVWLLGKLDSFEPLPGDLVEKYIFLWNSHDGKSALRCLPVTNRVVCMNTAQAALSNKGGFKLHHTSNLYSRIEEARKVLGVSKTQLNSFKEFSVAASRKQLSSSKFKELTEVLLPDPPEKVNPRRVKLQREKLTELFENGSGTEIPGVRGSGWGAFNAVTEYTNFYRPARGKNQEERRLESTLLGSSAKMIAKARKFLVTA